MRRTEAITCTPISSNSSRSVFTCARPGGPAGGQSQLLQQHAGRGREQDAELVRGEARAAGAIEGDIEEFLDPVLGVATGAVDALVDALRLAHEVGDDKAGVQARPSRRTTSALQTTRRSRSHVPAA